jgi:hypothetical protein
MSKIPTIAMIPSAYKANKVYSVLPTNGDADLDFARTSTRTRVNEIGLIEDLATGVPALDYTDGGCPSLLVEPQSTNLITYSEDFSDASWSKSNATITSNAIISPKGGLTATKLVEDNTNSQHKIQETAVSVSVGNVIYSQFIKKGERSKVLLEIGGGGGSASFDLDLGIVISQTNVTAEIKSYDNDWYRCSVYYSAPSTSVFIGTYILNDLEETSYQGDGTSGVYIWGAQVEEQSYATSYIPTSGATATRVAETLSKTGLSNYINSSEGVLYGNLSQLNSDTSIRVVSLNNSSSDRVYFGFFSSSVIYGVRSNGVVQFENSYNISSSLDFIKFAIKYKENDFSLWINGVEVNTVITGVTPINLTDLSFDGGSLTTPFYGKVKDLRVYNQVLTDTELQNLTS